MRRCDSETASQCPPGCVGHVCASLHARSTPLRHASRQPSRAGSAAAESPNDPRAYHDAASEASANEGRPNAEASPDAAASIAADREAASATS